MADLTNSLFFLFQIRVVNAFRMGLDNMDRRSLSSMGSLSNMNRYLKRHQSIEYADAEVVQAQTADTVM